ncbi:TldD/PmbA family protein [Petrotoga sp. 9PWA.NaAc.5.4]|uniref:TldD/PmbA family protein n=1 Tax=Petrotoga sp. 9PWA.NaAc.5.4 TaxID=1434328 RepID=UPI0013049343|nr:TldD/PmbA family protein [Petrotoga sp. 9PWA.NaAc.5.4]
MNLSKQQYLEILNNSLSSGGEYSEIFYEDVFGTNILYDNGKIEKVNFSSRKGASIRVVSEDETVFAHTNDPTFENLKSLADTLKKIASERFNSESIIKVENLEEKEKIDFSPFKIPFDTVSIDEKIEKVLKGVNLLKNADKRIKQITVSYSDSSRKVKVINSEGKIVEDIRNYPVYSVIVYAEDNNGNLYRGYSSDAANMGFEFFTDEMIEKLTKDVVRQVVSQIEGEDAPAGEFTVVLSSEAGGTMIHEACGHGMEADLVLSGSVYRDKVGKKIASEKINVVDDGTDKNKRGTLNYDDEGTPTKRTVLIENGILKGYMHSKITAKKFNVESTGNGRRESYMVLPIVRMRNTMILPGKDNPEDIIKSVKYGIFVRKMGGGQVDVISGDFQFGVDEGYIIENGELKNSIRGASLVGNGLKVLESIDMVGNDLGYGVGTCGKDGQGAPVSDAQPTIRIPKLIVGGIVKGGSK